jgi:Domain of unknown function (DUF4129)
LEPREDTRPEHRPRSALRVLALSVGMLVLLSLVAAVSRAHHVPGGRSGVHSPPHGVADYLFTIFALIIVVDFFFVVWLWFSNRDVLAQQRLQRRRSWRSLISVIAFALVAATLVRTHPFGIGGGSRSRSGLDVGASTKALLNGAKERGTPRTPEFQLLPVVVAAAAGLAVLGVIGVRSARRERRGLDEAYLLQLEFESLVEDTLADLYAEQDPRKAIIAAYARVERLFATYGLARDAAEAPVEYLDRVLPELRASGAALGRLTRLFEWAKFSAHDVEPGMRDDAIHALVEVRDELRANRLEEELLKASQPATVRS